MADETKKLTQGDIDKIRIACNIRFFVSGVNLMGDVKTDIPEDMTEEEVVQANSLMCFVNGLLSEGIRNHDYFMMIGKNIVMGKDTHRLLGMEPSGRA